MANFFQLDQNELDREWVRQPELYHKYATKLAETREALERAKENKELVIAELDREIRANPQQFGLEKITEKVVENTIILSKKYKIANEEFRTARHNENLAQVDVGTLDHRKKALEKLVDLLLADYFSKPVSRTGKERMERIETNAAFGHGKKRQ